MQVRNFRWVIVFMLFAGTAISYVDRQALTVLAPVLRDELGISNTGYASILTAFLLAYTVMQPITGWLVDRIGTRLGFAVLMGWWSIAAILHAFGGSVVSFMALRFLLGMGEAGSWSACVRAVSEWLPLRERGLATGLWASGVSVGLVVSVPLVAALNVTLGWRWTFVLTGISGLIWLFAWLRIYDLPQRHPAVTEQERRYIAEGSSAADVAAVSYRDLLKSRNMWAILGARVLADPWVWFYYFWIPEYLTRSLHFTPADIGKYAWIPFLVQGIGSLLGGTFSDALYRRGMSVINARLVVMLAGMLLMVPGLLAAFPLDIVVIFVGISSAMFGFGLWSPNMMSLCADAFPRGAVGSVTGLGGMGAGLGGMFFTMLTGWLLDHYDYRPVFALAGTIPLVAFVVLFVLIDRKRMRST